MNSNSSRTSRSRVSSMKAIRPNTRNSKVRSSIRLDFQLKPRFDVFFTGSMVPFGLRMLNAELPLYLARSEESISNLYKLLQTTDKIIKELAQDESMPSLE